MSDTFQGAGWWMASDGKWYPPETYPQAVPDQATPPSPGPAVPVQPSDLESFPGGLPSAWVAPEPVTPPQTLPVYVPPGPSAQPLPQAVAAAPVMAPVQPSPAPEIFGAAPPAKRRRIPPFVAWILAGIFFVTSVALGIAAVHENNVANQWHQDYTKATLQLAAARASIKSLNAQVSSLNGQVSTLNTQLSAEASAKEKALDQNTVLSQLVNEESSVSTELNTCVTDLQTFITTVGTDLGDGNYYDPYLSSESSTASADCNQAQSANQTLQSALSGASG